MGRDTVLVELDEGPADEPVGALDDLAPGGGQGRHRWRRWLLASAVVAVVLGGLSGVQLVVDARQRAAWDELAARSDAVLRPLAQTLTATSQADLPLPLWTAAGYRDSAVGLVGTADGSLDAVAVGLDDWQVRWREPLIGPTPGLSEGETRWPTGDCRRVSDAVAVACLFDDSLVVVRDENGLTSTMVLREATAHRLVVLDPRTGTVLVDQELTGEVLGTMALLPGLAVVAVVNDSADPAARGVDLVGVGLDDGVQRWRTPTQAVVDLTAGAYTQLGTVGSSVAFATALMTSDRRDTASSSVTFVGADGTLLRTVSGLVNPAWFVDSGDRQSVILSEQTTTVFAADGNDVTLPAVVTTATIDDGSLGALWFADGAAYDGTGTLLWRMPAGTGYNVPVVLRGTVYVAADDQVVAVDGATGKELWRTERTGEPVGDLLTDGSVLAAVVGPGGLPSRLVAFDLRDGRRQWDADLPAGLGGLYSTHHTLTGWTSSDGLAVVLR